MDSPSNTADEIMFADFPTELVGFEKMDKYMLRCWIIGHGILLGWEYVPISTLKGDLVKSGETVRVEIRSSGVKLAHGEKTDLLETQL